MRSAATEQQQKAKQVFRAMNNRCFVVMEIGWEYNDSTYDRRAGSPDEVFENEAAAREACAKVNMKWARDNANELWAYCDGNSVFVDHQQAEEAAGLKLPSQINSRDGGELYYEQVGQIVKKLDDATLLKLLPFFTVGAYEVVETKFAQE